MHVYFYMYIYVLYIMLYVCIYIYMLRIVKTQLPFLVTFDLVLHLDQVRNVFLSFLTLFFRFVVEFYDCCLLQIK